MAAWESKRTLKALPETITPKSSHSQFWTLMVSSHICYQDRRCWVTRASVLSLQENAPIVVSRSSLPQVLPTLDAESVVRCRYLLNMTAAFSLARSYNFEWPQSARPGHPNSTGYCNDVVSGCRESLTVLAEVDRPLHSKRRKIFESI